MLLPTPCTSPVCVLPEGIRLNSRSEEEEGKWGREGTPLTTDPSTTVSFTDTSWDQMAKVMPWPAQRSEVGGGGVTEIFLPGDHNETQQVCSFKRTHGGGACIYPALLSPRWGFNSPPLVRLKPRRSSSSTLGSGLEVGPGKNLCRFSQFQNLHSQGHAEPPAGSLCLAKGCLQHIMSRSSKFSNKGANLKHSSCW